MPVRYYIILPGDSECDCLGEANLLGETSFGSFYSSQGVVVLSKLLEQHSEVLEYTIIKDQQGNQITLDQFLTILNTHRLY